jgi:hypothetical protein
MAPTTVAATPRPPSDFDALSLLLADSRLVLTLLNQGRYAVLRRVFGVSREEANLLTFVLALGGIDVAYGTAQRLIHMPIPLSSRDAALGGFVLREGALGVAGPNARTVPFAGALLAAALVGGLAVPGMRRAMLNARAAEHRIRLARERRYSEARGALLALRDTVAARAGRAVETA